MPPNEVWLGRTLERLVVSTYGPLLLYIGYRLFVMGVTGDMKITTKMGAKSATITSVAPGTLCFILAVVLSWVMMNAVLKVPVEPSPNPNDKNGPDNIFFYGGKEASTRPLSELLRFGIADLYLCESAATLATETARTECQKKYQLKFQRIPSQTDLAIVDAAEAQFYKSNPDQDAIRKMNKLRAQYLVTGSSQ